MKVLVLNGSPRKGGNTALAVGEFVRTIEEQGI